MVIPVGLAMIFSLIVGLQANRDFADGFVQDADDAFFKRFEYLPASICVCLER